jgi:hypothetical protein
MFGFGKAKEKKPKEPRRQGFMTEDDKWVEFGPDEPFIYEGKRWGLVRKGTVWPPVCADHGDRLDLWQAIAEGLNNLSANRFILKKLRQVSADYKAGKISATDVTTIVNKIVTVTKDIKVG